MALDDFVKSFKFTNICKYNDDDVHSAVIKTKPVPEQNWFEFELGDNF